MDRHEVLELSLAHRAVAVDAAGAPRDGPRDVDVRDDVEPVLRASRDKGVHAAQGVGVKAKRPGGILPPNPSGGFAAWHEGVGVLADKATIVVVDADGVVAKTREMCRDGVGLLHVGEIGAAGNVYAPESDCLSGTLLELEVAVAHHYAPVYAARRVCGGNVREVQRRTRLDVALDLERHPGGGGGAVATTGDE